MVKGLLAWSMPAILPSKAERLEPAAAFRRRACACFLCASLPLTTARCRLIDLLWTKEVGPLLVAATVPNVSKAASLFRIAMASAMAASSFVLSAVRSSYSLALAEHILINSSRKVSASPFCFSASDSCPLLVASVPSFVLRLPCLDWYEPSMTACAFVMVSMYLMCASAARCSVVRASAKLLVNVSLMSFKMPTTSLDCVV
mmetsp:Transcript_36508/g.98830  ORF Transcript_36508/g.98830 Transcript_36508/m.98830 type:complete len:202 (+) Transcript_36508:1052-1657(+)